MAGTKTRKWKYGTSYTQEGVTSYSAHFTENISQAVDKAIDDSLRAMKKCMPQKVTVNQSSRDFIFN